MLYSPNWDREAHRIAKLNRRKRNKLRAIEYKGGVCLNCKEVFHQAAMTFHHRDPTQKELSPGQMMGHSWDRLQAELDKCDLLCSNCHLTLHHMLEVS